MVKIEKNSSYRLFLLGLIVLLFVVFIVSIGAGRFYISPPDVIRILFSPESGSGSYFQRATSIIYTLRLPRAAAAVLIGAALSLSGASYQSVFKNPLVAPDMLGVSSGACVGAAIGILTGFSQTGIQVAAFAGGILAVSLAVMMPRIIRSNTLIMLVLSGIIVGGLMNSILGIIKYAADSDTQLPAITYWQMGSLANVTWANIVSCGVPIVLCFIFMMAIRWRMNILTLNEEEAYMLGSHTTQLRYAIIFCATVMTASSVCLSGTVGWIGLVIPHISRILVGSDNCRVVPVSLVLGAVFLVLVDLISRTALNTEIPLSILTGLIGAPFYFYLLVRERMALS